MMPETDSSPEAQRAVQNALQLVCVSLPHLSGLAHAARVQLDSRIPSARVFESGRILLNPDWFRGLERGDAVFILAHELLHLALRTHQRGQGSEPRLVNIAHDYIINDMLVEALGRSIPDGGLEWYGARHESLEAIVRQLQQVVQSGGNILWRAAGGSPESGTAMSEAMRAAGLVGADAHPGYEGDVLSSEEEREWFPDVDPGEQKVAQEVILRAAAKAASLERLQEGIERLATLPPEHGGRAGRYVLASHALRGFYRTPWELALQRWMEAVAPGPRSYARPSRRGADRTDVVLAGRTREGWRLNVVLDTSGSMTAEFPRVLGAIASFCESVNAGQVRVLQCDVEVTADQIFSPEQLLEVEIAGLGGSSLRPAMLLLAQDPEVEAAVIITDGVIHYPRRPVPYAVLWVLTDPERDFEPGYGQVIHLPPLSEPDPLFQQ